MLFILLILVGLYITIATITTQNLLPKRKYQTTINNHPSINVWISSLAVMVFMAVVISLPTHVSLSSSLSLPSAYSSRLKGIFVSIVFGIMIIAVYSARLNIHNDDPEIKRTTMSSIVNTIASCIPLIVATLGSAGIAQALDIDYKSIGSIIILFVILAVPTSIGTILLMLFSRASDSVIPIYSTLVGIWGSILMLA